jgi:UDP-glucose 4-epimerase
LLSARSNSAVTAATAIGTGIGADVNDIEAMIRGAVVAVRSRQSHGDTLPPPEHVPARPGDLRSNLVDATRAGEVLGWRPTVALAEGLSLTAEWFAARDRA